MGEVFVPEFDPALEEEVEAISELEIEEDGVVEKLELEGELEELAEDEEPEVELLKTQAGSTGFVLFVEFANVGDVPFERMGADGYGGADELVEFELGVGAYGGDAGLEVVFVIDIEGAAAHATAPSRRQSPDSTGFVVAAAYADVVFAGTKLGAATYGVDVELEQVVFDGTAGAVTFGAALEVVFNLT